MDDTKKMLRAIINGQSAMKQELLQRIEKSEDSLSKKVEDLKKSTELGFKEVNERLNKQGKSLAYLEDDAPTREEFDGLEVRVKKVEHRVASL